MPKPLAIVSVINDLATDQRVRRTCMLLLKNGYEVLQVGRIKKDSLPLPLLPYKTHRMKLWFEKGPAFYLCFTIGLFFFLRKNKASLLIANDLDTLWPNYFFSRKRNCPLIYDSHEIFCEVPELQHSPLKKKLWEGLEKRIVPKLKYCITVNQSIADWFNHRYKQDFKVVRNIPERVSTDAAKTRKELDLPADKKIILLQGAGINIQRGAEEVVEAMQYISNAVLLIIGSGDAIPGIKLKIDRSSFRDKFILLPKMPPADLYQYTCNADIGLSLDKDTNINYRFSLPNKIFDYIHAGIPVLVSPLTEIKSFVEKYKVGDCIQNHDPKHIAGKINTMLSSPMYQQWKLNTRKAASENSWEKEKQVWIQLLNQIEIT